MVHTKRVHHSTNYVVFIVLNAGAGADLEIVGGGCWVQTIGRAAADGRPEARSAGGRPGGGFRGITPEKFLKFYIAKDAFSCIINGIYSVILH